MKMSFWMTGMIQNCFWCVSLFARKKKGRNFVFVFVQFFRKIVFQHFNTSNFSTSSQIWCLQNQKLAFFMNLSPCRYSSRAFDSKKLQLPSCELSSFRDSWIKETDPKFRVFGALAIPFLMEEKKSKFCIFVRSLKKKKSYSNISIPQFQHLLPNLISSKSKIDLFHEFGATCFFWLKKIAF